MDIINQTIDFYQRAQQVADPRVVDWPLLSSPFPTLAVVILYFFIVFISGPRFMEKREPFDFGMFLPAYNFALVALNYYILKEAFVGSYRAGYSYVCTPLRSDSYDPNEIMVANSIWWYYFSKIIELFDTLLFVLRKRRRQITVLHVYHHSTMPLIWWIGAKWHPGGQAFFSVMLNSLVHVVMYSYYGLTALGPKVHKYLWWKKYITILQLVQFCAAIFHTARSLYVACPSPVWMHWSLIGYAISMFILFSNFYIQAYMKSTPMSKQGKPNDQAARRHNVANSDAKIQRDPVVRKKLSHRQRKEE